MSNQGARAAALANAVLAVLEKHSINALVIGGVALAAHHYPRATDDFDLGIATPKATLPMVRDDLLALGYSVEFREPDDQDPLGGVIDVIDDSGAFVQVVNFDNSPSGGFPAIILDALKEVSPLPGTLHVIPLRHLIATKLYAGGPKSRQDILELVKANPEEDWSAVRAFCARFRLNTDVLP